MEPNYEIETPKKVEPAFLPDEFLSDLTTNDSNFTFKNTREEAVESDYGQKPLYDFVAVYFLGIYDRTQTGGPPSMQFKAYSKSLDGWGVNPYFLTTIFVKALAWELMGPSEWKKIWEASDNKTDWWHASVQSPIFSRNWPWTAKAQSQHEWYNGINPKFGVVTHPLEYTAVFVNEKEDN